MLAEMWSRSESGSQFRRRAECKAEREAEACEAQELREQERARLQHEQEESHRLRLELTKQRDQAAALLDGGWQSLVEEGTPPSRVTAGGQQEPEHGSPLTRECSVSPQILRTQSLVNTIVDFVESNGDRIERSILIRQLDALGIAGICDALQHKYGRRPQVVGVEDSRAAERSSPAAVELDSVCRPTAVDRRWRGLLASIWTPARALSPLEVELSGLKLGALSRQVVEGGATVEQLEAMQDEDDPKAALIRWLVQRSKPDDEQSPLSPTRAGDDGAMATNAADATAGAGISEGEPPVRAPEPRRDLEDDFAALSLAIESASPPQHAFGRAKTTGKPAVDAHVGIHRFEALLSQLGLESHAVALRADGIVDEEDLRGLTVEEASGLLPTLTVEARNRWIQWRAATGE